MNVFQGYPLCFFTVLVNDSEREAIQKLSSASELKVESSSCSGRMLPDTESSGWEVSRVPMSVNQVLPTMLGLSAPIWPLSLFFWGTHQDKRLRTSTLPLESCCECLRDLSPVKSAVGAARVWRYRDWF